MSIYTQPEISIRRIGPSNVPATSGFTPSVNTGGENLTIDNEKQDPSSALGKSNDLWED